VTTAAEKHILLVEDDADIADLLKLHLTDEGYEVDVVDDGDEGLERARSGRYDLIVLDIMLPGTDGFDICRRLRQEKCHVPILMVTAKTEEVDKVLGLELGADDYITKPFSIREVLARVKAMFRRVEVDRDAQPQDDGDTPIEFDGLVIEPTKRKVTAGGKSVDLTSKEYELLLLFARNPGRAYSRQELLDEVWGYQYSGYSHTVNTHINRLRNKIEPNPSSPRFVKTVWGVGYRFAEREELEASDAQ
jgi:DNA-binding response OmpR family regulator